MVMAVSEEKDYQSLIQYILKNNLLNAEVFKLIIILQTYKTKLKAKIENQTVIPYIHHHRLGFQMLLTLIEKLLKHIFLTKRRIEGV